MKYFQINENNLFNKRQNGTPRQFSHYITPRQPTIGDLSFELGTHQLLLVCVHPGQEADVAHLRVERVFPNVDSAARLCNDARLPVDHARALHTDQHLVVAQLAVVLGPGQWT